MKAIKFRYWDEEAKEFEYSEVIGLANFFFFFPEGDLYTGINDIKGINIYEYDIVKYRFSDDEDFGTYLVKWLNTEAGFGAEDFTSWIHLSSRMEVVGNKYQNPELIEK